VASNLVALGVKHVAVLGAIGDDGFAFELTRALNTRGISSELCVKSPDVPTFTYTKLINIETGAEDLPRVDFINTLPVAEEVNRKIVANAREYVASFDVVLVSDQAETPAGGVITPALRDALAHIAADYPDKIIWVDSRMRGEHFRNVILKSNQDEADAACLRALHRIDYAALKEHTNAPLLVVTGGQEGVDLFEGNGQPRHVKTKRIVEPVDICGAGDSFSAGAVLALAVTRSAPAAARFGNMVASITIMKKGTGTASPQEVLAAEKDWPE
jgi:bifunctional ADP-heptose synthase (sugar kinase/adenylyltransferase)